MFTGWLSFAGTELINTARAAALSPINVSCDCPDLAASLGDPDYDTIPVDHPDWPAPWFDPGEPVSKDFHGFVGLEFTGADKATGERQWTELLGDGGVGGALRRGSRELEVRAVALAAHEEALSWGIAWLASALRGGNCQDGCAGESLCAYVACPEVPRPARHTRDYAELATQTGDRLQRELLNVSLIEGPEVTARTALPSGWVAELRFVLKAGTPYWYRRPFTIIDSRTGELPGYWQDIVHGYNPVDLKAICDKRELERTNCLDANPYCRPDIEQPWRPEHPPVPPDPCYPVSTFNGLRTWLTIPKVQAPGWLERVPIFRIFTGAFPIKRLHLRWYDNPRGDQCRGAGGSGDLTPAYEQACSACAEINIPWLPAYSTFTLDGRTQRAWIECPGAQGGVVEPTLYGGGGLLFTWPVFDCSTSQCFEILCDTTVASNLWFAAEMAVREDAA